MQTVLDFLNAAEPYLESVVALLLAIFLPIIYKKVYLFVQARLKGRTPEWLHILITGYAKPTAKILRLVFIYFALLVLPFEFNTDRYKNILRLVLDVLVVLYLGIGAWNASPMCHLILHGAQNKMDIPINKTLNKFIENLFRALVAIITGIAMLDRFGVPVTGLMTSAGIAGLALSLAAQSTLSSLIAGVALVLEHPFDIGDYIVLGSYEGTVEDISLRSTKIRTPDNVAVTIENSKVASEYIQNCSRRTSRLWQFTIGLTYDTPPADLDTICRTLKTVIETTDGVAPDGVSVTVDKFNDSSVDLLARVYTSSADYGAFLNLKSVLNVKIKDTVEGAGLSFAFPTTTIDMPEEAASA